MRQIPGQSEVETKRWLWKEAVDNQRQAELRTARALSELIGALAEEEYRKRGVVVEPVLELNGNGPERAAGEDRRGGGSAEA
jgi:hypothetical protein